MSDKTHAVTIKIRAFPYYVDEEDPVTGKMVRREKVATRGEEVELSESDFNRAERFDAILQAGDETSASDETGSSGSIDVENASTAEISEFLVAEKPNEDETVALAEDQKSNAEKLIAAENMATGQQPRKGVIKRLQDIVDANG